MADRFYGLDRGDGAAVPTESSSSVTKDVEIVVDLAIGMDKVEVVHLLTRMRDHITAGIWPPA